MSVDTKESNSKKLILPDIKERFVSKKILEDKSNCANTIKRFFNEDEEKVKNLNFYDPLIFSMENKDIIRSTSYGLFSILNTDTKVNNKKAHKPQNSNNNNHDIHTQSNNHGKYMLFFHKS